MSIENEAFLAQCKSMKLEQLESLVENGELTKEQDLICKTEINSILGNRKYNLEEDGAPEIITSAKIYHEKQASESGTLNGMLGNASKISPDEVQEDLKGG